MPFIPVTDIINFEPTVGNVGVQSEPLNATVVPGGVSPPGATNQTILWSLPDPVPGATLSITGAGSVVTPTAHGWIRVRATVKNGKEP
jgi:hypothetical protein